MRGVPNRDAALLFLSGETGELVYGDGLFPWHGERVTLLNYSSPLSRVSVGLFVYVFRGETSVLLNYSNLSPSFPPWHVSSVGVLVLGRVLLGGGRVGLGCVWGGGWGGWGGCLSVWGGEWSGWRGEVVLGRALERVVGGGGK